MLDSCSPFPFIQRPPQNKDLCLLFVFSLHSAQENGIEKNEQLFRSQHAQN